MHMIIHNKEKIHTCVQCPKSFGRADSLKTHVLPTAERRPTLAQNVRSHLEKQERCGGTLLLTLGRKYINVQNAENHLV